MPKICDKINKDLCFLCDHKFSKREKSWMLFKAFTLKKYQLTTTFSNILSCVLEFTIGKQSVHSELLCKKCKVLMLEFIDKEQELNKLRNCIFELHKQTTETYKLISKDLNVNHKSNETVNEPQKSTVENNDNDSDGENIILKMVDEVFTHDNSNYEFINESTKRTTDAINEEITLNNTESDLNEEIVNCDINKNSKQDINKVKSLTSSNNSLQTSTHSIHKNELKSTSKNTQIISAEVNLNTFKCKICEKPFTKKKSYWRHMNMHNEQIKSRYACDICGKRFVNIHNLKNHKNLHNKNSNYKPPSRYFCIVCNKGYSKRCKFNEHYKIHANLKHFYYHCDLCNKILCKKSDLTRHKMLFCTENLKRQRNHKKNLKDTAELYKCETCDKKYLTNEGLRIHMINRHLKNRKSPLQCDICLKIFRNMKFLKEHRRWHAGIERRVKCIDCNQRISIKFLSKHKMLHLLSKVMKLSNAEMVISFKPKHKSTEACQKCGQIISNPYVMSAHIEKHIKLAKLKRFSCGHCDKKYTSEYDLYLHDKMEHDITKRKKSLENITYDVNTTLKKVYNCNECGKLFAANSTLKWHMETHINVKEWNNNEKRTEKVNKNTTNHYECEKCGKIYPSHQGYKYHIKSHSAILYECDICKVNFLRKINLDKHKFMHMDKNMKPTYECDVCHKKFFNIKNVKQHQLMHSSKTFNCDDCGKEFSQLRYLKRHKKQKIH